MLPIGEIQNLKEPIPLTDLVLSADNKILVLAPHPDDFDEVAVTLRYFHSRGHPILLLVLTGASSGVLDSFVDPPTTHKKPSNSKLRD